MITCNIFQYMLVFNNFGKVIFLIWKRLAVLYYFMNSKSCPPFLLNFNASQKKVCRSATSSQIKKNKPFHISIIINFFLSLELALLKQSYRI